MPGVNEFKVQEILNRVFDPTNNRLNVSIGAANQTFDDDIALRLGTDNDVVLLNRSTALTADAEITGVIVGTSDHQGLAANSLIVSNITADGDIGLYVNNGGNSLEAILIDASAKIIYLGFGTFTNVTFSAANSTNNTTLTVENTSNAAAASNAIINITVGGGTSTGDPQLRLTVTGAGAAYFAVDNSLGDQVVFGTGATVGSTYASGAAHILYGSGKVSFLPSGALSSMSGTNIMFDGWTQTVTAAWYQVMFNNNYTITANTTGAMAGLFIYNPPIVVGTGTPATVTTLYIATVSSVGTDNWAVWVDLGKVRVDDQILLGITDSTPTFAAAGSMIAAGGVAIGADALANVIDDASNGAGSTVLYIGTSTIDVTASSIQWKENVSLVDGAAKQHLEVFSGLLREYDYKNGDGHFIGMIAEDVKEVLPQYVVGMDTPSLRYHYMVGPLIWGWKSHEAKIAKLEQQLIAAGIVPEE